MGSTPSPSGCTETRSLVVFCRRHRSASWPNLTAVTRCQTPTIKSYWSIHILAGAGVAGFGAGGSVDVSGGTPQGYDGRYDVITSLACDGSYYPSVWFVTDCDARWSCYPSVRYGLYLASAAGPRAKRMRGRRDRIRELDHSYLDFYLFIYTFGSKWLKP